MRITLVIFAALTLLPGCKTWKKIGHEVRITDSVRIKDTLVFTNVVNVKDSTVIKDTVLRIAGSTAQVKIPVNSTADTVLKVGHATVRRTVNNGQETISADCEALAVEVTDLKIVYHTSQSQVDSFRKVLADRVSKTQEVTVVQQQKSWLGRLWQKVKDKFAWFGLICLVAIIIYLVKKFVT